MEEAQAKALREVHARKLVLDTIAAHRAPPLDGSEGQDARTKWAVYMRSVHKLWPFETVSMDAELAASLSGPAWEQFNAMCREEGESDADFATRVIDTFASVKALTSQEGYLHMSRLMSWKRRPGESLDQVYSSLKKEVSKLPWDAAFQNDILYTMFLQVLPPSDRKMIQATDNRTPEGALNVAKRMEAAGSNANIDVDPVAAAMAQVALSSGSSSGASSLTPDELKDIVEKTMSQSKCMTELSKQLEELKSSLELDDAPEPPKNGKGRRRRRGKQQGNSAGQLNALQAAPTQQQTVQSPQQGAQPAQQGLQQMRQGYQPMPGYQQAQQGFPAMPPSFQPMDQGFPPMPQSFSPAQQGYQPVYQGVPPMQQGYQSAPRRFYNGQQRFQVKCQLCHAPGHAAPLCDRWPLRANSSGGNGNSRPQQFARHPAGSTQRPAVECFYCHQLGHVKRECPNRNSFQGQNQQFQQAGAQMGQTPALQQPFQQLPMQQQPFQQLPMQQVPSSAQQMGNFAPVR